MIEKTLAHGGAAYAQTRNLVRKELKVKYKNSALRFVWSMLNPLFLLAVYGVAFSILGKYSLSSRPVLSFRRRANRLAVPGSEYQALQQSCPKFWTLQAFSLRPAA